MSLAAAESRGSHRDLPIALLFTLSVFLSSALLFLIEPMIARALLPQYGGSPAVWNTCVVGFQCLLLAGYAWAHGNARLERRQARTIIPLAIVVASLAVLPFSLPDMVNHSASPSLSVLLSLGATIALPFTLLAANSALAQRWFAEVSSRDPYPLYAASNAGSLIALVSYPLFFEPMFGLTDGWRIWAGGYVCFAAITAVSAAVVLTIRNRQVPIRRPGSDVRRGWRQPAGWLIRSAVGSSLLLSATMKMTTDIGSAPLLWVLPLSLYLMTFVIAFSPRIALPRTPIAVLTAVAIAWSLTVLIYTFAMPVWLSVAGLTFTVFFGCLLCHRDLASSKPPPERLTQFYFWIALGGALGGVLNSLVAPLLFDSIAEFPITLFALTVLIHAEGDYRKKFARERMRRPGTWLPPAFAVLALLAGAIVMTMAREGTLSPLAAAAGKLVPLALIIQGLLLARHAGQFEVVVLLILLLTASGFSSAAVISERRSFFGTMRVVDTTAERIVVHGTTVHGAQRKEAALSNLPTRYYHPAGPFGREAFERRPALDAAVVGLGAGSLAAMARPDDRLTFLEIDPLVEEMARTYFTFIRDARGKIDVRIGDGRLLLNDAGDRSFDVIIVDAFSSDAIPTHLLTREALNLYLRKVKPDGVVLIHISNQHLDLTRVFRGWSAAERRPVAVLGYRPAAREASQGAAPTLAVAIAPKRETLEELVRGRWTWLGPGRSVEWTDDRTDLLGVIGKIRF